jgi:glyoxylase-like metal-dependent hydrolase (beta-lactamase superfamily II)
LPVPAPSTVELGRLRVDLLSDGTFALDGGAMFGVVPRVVWEKSDPPDEKNRVTLGLNVALVLTEDGKRILVDTGMGDKWTEKERAIYRIERSSTIPGELAARGLGPADIDVVINTHLHFDHAGGNTVWRSGQAVPTFPRARYVVQRGEWQDATHAHERNRASYREENFRPLEASGQLDLVEGEAEIAKGVRVVPVGGHTAHHQMVVITGGGRTLAVPTDLLPTTSHLPLPFVMSYDLFPVATLEAKRVFLTRAAEEHWDVLFYHDARTPLGRVQRAQDRFVLSEGF